MIWLKDFKDQILKNATLTTLEKLAIFWRLVNIEAQTIVSKVEDELENYSDPTDIEELQEYWIREDIQVKCTTDA